MALSIAEARELKWLAGLGPRLFSERKRRFISLFKRANLSELVVAGMTQAEVNLGYRLVDEYEVEERDRVRRENVRNYVYDEFIFHEGDDWDPEEEEFIRNAAEGQQQIELVPTVHNGTPALALVIPDKDRVYLSKDAAELLIMQLHHWKDHGKLRIPKAGMRP